ncbi:galactonate dehydratase [Devosia nitrariae]|uniref:Galactonate dehydratase n=1 Tax=Devosia nitrariae TaxID=2071872 RepID=A0ABQ5WBV5_9HYPH|nr:galactonate dehydratase [Devosia nitrariae]GLQ57203.1 galactonate dehydratase [Devosia nitrariae]
MKITAVQTVVVNAVHRNWIFVKVLTDQPGLHGWGEATLEWKTRAVCATIEDLAPFVVGEDPMRIEHMVRRMTGFSFWPLGAIGLTAVSGIEQALWDIKGKALGVPVHQLLGGRVRDHVRVYTHLRRAKIGAQVPTSDIGVFCDAVQETVEMGYNAIKLGFVPYTGYDAPLPAVRHVEKLAAAVRERVGDEIEIMTDFHGRPDSIEAAKAYIDAIAPIRPLFVEEAIQPGDAPAMADLARRVDCPLATGERLFTPREFAEIAEHRAVAYIQPDLAHCGGLTGGRKIAAIAEAAHMGVAPHNPMGPVAGAVALHFDLATPNFLIQEEAVGLVPWFRDICTDAYPLDMQNGVWGVPEAPGLGIEIDEAAAARHPFKQEEIPALEAILPDGRIANW